MRVFFIFLVGLLLSTLIVSGDDELLIPIGGDSEFYFDNNADNEMNIFTGSLINLSINLISPENGTIFTTTLDTDIVFQFTSTNPYNRTLNFTIYINDNINQSGLNVSNFTINFKNAGTYTWYIVVDDGISNTTSEKRTFTIQEPTKPSKGGGYTGPSGTEISVSKTWVEINESAIWQINDSNIPIIEVFFATGRRVTDSELKITKKNPQVLDKKPSFFYCEFTKKNINDEDITKIIIKFRVTKSWLRENGINENDIALKRYTNEWRELPTRIISNDESNFYYESESPGFSYFSIGEKSKTEEITGNVIVQPIPQMEEERKEEVKKEKVEEKVEEKKDYFWFAVLIVIIIVLVGLIIIIKTHKRHHITKHKEKIKEHNREPLEREIRVTRKEISHDKILRELKKEIEEEEKILKKEDKEMRKIDDFKHDLLKELHQKYHKK